VGYMNKMWAEMLLEPQLPDTAESIYSQAIDEAIDILETTQKRGVFTDHKLALAWQAMRLLKQAKEKANEISE
jgi:transcription initiation factor IIE alpha subunit